MIEDPEKLEKQIQRNQETENALHRNFRPRETQATQGEAQTEQEQAAKKEIQPIAQEQVAAASEPAHDYPIQGDADERGTLAASFSRFESTDTGQRIAQSIREHDTTIRFGVPERNAVAQFDPNTSEITIRESMKDASPEILAAHLAHEGTHVQWDKPDSIDQEYHCFKAQADAWNQLKGDQSDEQCDWVGQTIARGEDEAKDEFRAMYPGLPEY